MPNRFSDYTKKIQDKLPYWFAQMKSNEESIGAQFLNVFGLGIEDIMYMIDYAFEQHNLNTIDTNQVNIVYKAFIPILIHPTYTITASSEGSMLTEYDTLEEFFMSLEGDFNYSEVYFPNPFIIDHENHGIYTRLQYNVSEENIYGIIHVNIMDGESTLYDNDIKLVPHPVWNFFDEFGLLLSTPRLGYESNEDYKLRLLDVFIHPSNTTKIGLLNGISRELGLRKNAIWTNGDLDYIIGDTISEDVNNISGKMIITNSIEVDGIQLESTDVFANIYNKKITLKGNENYRDIPRTISWIQGFNIHELSNQEDLVLQAQIDTPSQTMIQYIVENISKKAPILWGNFIWDEATWNIGEYIITRLPNQLDASF